MNENITDLYADLVFALNALSDANQTVEPFDGVLEGPEGDTVYYNSNTNHWVFVPASHRL